ncbi:glycoside hydrolase family 43 protein [Bacteroidota bacterium]
MKLKSPIPTWSVRKILSFLLMFCASVIINAQIHPNPFAANPLPDEEITYTNPVIPGFYSDPSICRVGDDYYLVTSTFEYFPGVPVFHSKDLVNWKQIGHCIHRVEQLPNGQNIFAATIRYHAGTFYMITTNVVNGGNFYVTATDPAGPWSDPVWVDIPGIDPDMFFDDDGKSYVISSPFILYEIDLETGKLLTEGRKIWHGAGGRYAEGPHIYKKDGFYYLMAAEGGTEEAHSETIARSNTIWGPYTENPANPILAHANAAGQDKLIQGLGHADIIQAHDGSWWIVFHGYRKSVPYPVHHILGRETCLAPVSWPKNGWPVVNGNGTASVNMTCETLPLKPFPEEQSRDEFNSDQLSLEWNFIQPPANKNAFFKLGNGSLHLTGLPTIIGDPGTPAFVGRRLQHMTFTATTQIEFDPVTDKEEAGLILLNNGQHFDVLIKRSGKNKVLYVKLQFGSIVYTSEEITLKDGPVKLRISGNDGSFIFSYTQDSDYVDIEKVDTRYLSTETVGWFTGVYVGLYATGNGKQSRTAASYDFFEYKGN